MIYHVRMKRIFTAFLLPLIMAACDRRVVEVNQEASPSEERKIDIYDLSTENLSGEKISLDEFRGKVTLMVNVASKCGFTPQYNAAPGAPGGLEGSRLLGRGVPVQ